MNFLKYFRVKLIFFLIFKYELSKNLSNFFFFLFIKDAENYILIIS